MDKYKRYYGVIVFGLALSLILFLAIKIIMPNINALTTAKNTLKEKQTELENLERDLNVVQSKIQKIKNSIIGAQKKIYSPVESDLGNETIFFTLYNDIVEMVHANSIKIKSIGYEYNPETDSFVKFGKDVYFVCDVNMELVSNYINLGKLIQDIYQYPYYIKINELEVKPYAKDKKILLSNLKIRLYAHTTPEEERSTSNVENKKIDGASTPLPNE